MAEESALDRPSRVMLIGLLVPETTLSSPEPVPPSEVKATSLAVTTDCGRTAIGEVTFLFAPCQVSEPMANLPRAAFWFSKETLKVFFSPAVPKVRIDGVTVTLTPGTSVLAR